MRQIRLRWRETGTRLYLRRWGRLALAFSIGVGCLIGADVASAAEPVAGQMPMKSFPVGQIFTFLFLMLGPFKIVAPFWKITRDADPAATRRIALWATLFSTLALLVAAFLGESFLKKYGIPIPILALSAGLILFLVALLNILQQFAPPTSHGGEAAGLPPAPEKSIALTPLAFPTIVTPYGIATLVVFLAVNPDPQNRLTIGAIVTAIMLLNLIVMIMTRRILPVLGVVLPIMGAVLGIIQVALGLQIIHSSLKALGIT